jgi:hypothetical protein
MTIAYAPSMCAQVDDVAAATQLVRFASEYSDLGLSARTYTLSSIKFG